AWPAEPERLHRAVQPHVPGGGARPVPVPAPRGRPRSRLVVDARVQRAAPPRFPRRYDARRGPPAVRGKFYFCFVCLTGKLTLEPTHIKKPSPCHLSCVTGRVFSPVFAAFQAKSVGC